MRFQVKLIFILLACLAAPAHGASQPDYAAQAEEMARQQDEAMRDPDSPVRLIPTPASLLAALPAGMQVKERCLVQQYMGSALIYINARKAGNPEKAIPDITINVEAQIFDLSGPAWQGYMKAASIQANREAVDEVMSCKDVRVWGNGHFTDAGQKKIFPWGGACARPAVWSRGEVLSPEIKDYDGYVGRYAGMVNTTRFSVEASGMSNAKDMDGVAEAIAASAQSLNFGELKP